MPNLFVAHFDHAIACNSKAQRDDIVKAAHEVTELVEALKPMALPPADFDPFLGFMVAEKRETA